MRSAFIAIGLAVACTGCGTVLTHTVIAPGATEGPTDVYRGTQTDVQMLRLVETVGAHLYPKPAGWGLIFSGLFIAGDIPLSAVGDTLIWPYDRINSPSDGRPADHPQ